MVESKQPPSELSVSIGQTNEDHHSSAMPVNDLNFSTEMTSDTTSTIEKLHEPLSGPQRFQNSVGLSSECSPSVVEEKHIGPLNSYPFQPNHSIPISMYPPQMLGNIQLAALFQQMQAQIYLFFQSQYIPTLIPNDSDTSKTNGKLETSCQNDTDFHTNSNSFPSKNFLTIRPAILAQLEERSSAVWSMHTDLISEIKKVTCSIIDKEKSLFGLQAELMHALKKANQLEDERLKEFSSNLQHAISYICDSRQALENIALDFNAIEDGESVDNLMLSLQAALKVIAENQLNERHLSQKQIDEITLQKHHLEEATFKLSHQNQQQVNAMIMEIEVLKQIIAQTRENGLSLTSNVDTLKDFIVQFIEDTDASSKALASQIEQMRKAALLILQSFLERDNRLRITVARMLCNFEDFHHCYCHDSELFCAKFLNLGAQIANILDLTMKISSLSESKISDMSSQLFRCHSQIHRLEAEVRDLRQRLSNQQDLIAELTQLREEVRLAECKYRDRDLAFQGEFNRILKEKDELAAKLESYKNIQEDKKESEAKEEDKEITPKAKRSKRIIVGENGTPSSASKPSLKSSNILITFTGFSDHALVVELKRTVQSLGGRVHTGAEFPDQVC